MQIHCYIKISHYIILKNLSNNIHSLPSSAIISIPLLEARQYKKILEANYKVLTVNGWASQAVCYPQFFPVQCYFQAIMEPCPGYQTERVRKRAIPHLVLAHCRRWVASTPNKAKDRWGHSAACARLSNECQGQSLFEQVLHIRHIIAFYNKGRENSILYNRFSYKMKLKNGRQALKLHLEHSHNASLAVRFCFHYSMDLWSNSGFRPVYVISRPWV